MGLLGPHTALLCAIHKISTPMAKGRSGMNTANVILNFTTEHINIHGVPIFTIFAVNGEL